MGNATDPAADWSVEAILAANGRRIEPSDRPGRHHWPEEIPQRAGSHQAPQTDDPVVAPAPVSWWQRQLAAYGLRPPVTLGR
jgi:hypothetical protein